MIDEDSLLLLADAVQSFEGVTSMDSIKETIAELLRDLEDIGDQNKEYDNESDFKWE